MPGNSHIIKFCCFIIFMGSSIHCSTNKTKTDLFSVHSKLYYKEKEDDKNKRRSITQETSLDAKNVTAVPATSHSEMFIVFDDSGSMQDSITNAQKAVMHLLVNTAATAKASEIPFVHLFPLNAERMLNVKYPYQNLIDYLKQGNPPLGNIELRQIVNGRRVSPPTGHGTPFASRVKEVSKYLSARIETLKKDNKNLKEAIFYIFTDGTPSGDPGETRSDWLKAIENLKTKASNFTNISVQLTMLGDAISPDLYSNFVKIQDTNTEKYFSLVVSRENIENIETNAQAFAERLLEDRLQSRILKANTLIREVESTIPSIKAQLSDLKSESLSKLSDSAAIEKLLNKAIEQFKNNKNQETVQGVASEFRKISNVFTEIVKVRDPVMKLEARVLDLYQRLNASGDDLKEIGEVIEKMTDKQRFMLPHLISHYESVKAFYEKIRNQFDGKGILSLHTETSNLLQSLTKKVKQVEKSYNIFLENSSSLISFLETLPEDVRQKLEADLASIKDIAIDYQSKTIIYTGAHIFKGTGKSGPGHQTNWTVVNRGTIVSLGGSSGGGAIAKEFINDGVVLHEASSADPSGDGYTHIVNRGKIIRLTQKIPIICPSGFTPCGISCCNKHSWAKLSRPRFHWQRYDENGKANFVIYNETDGSIYNVTWDFVLNFKRGTTWGGRVYNFFARLFSDNKVVEALHEKDINDLQGDEAKAFLQSLYPERIKVLRRTEDEWLALVPKGLIPAFEDILCIEMNGDLGYGRRALTDKGLKEELEVKRKAQCGR